MNQKFGENKDHNTVQGKFVGLNQTKQNRVSFQKSGMLFDFMFQILYQTNLEYLYQCNMQAGEQADLTE